MSSAMMAPSAGDGAGPSSRAVVPVEAAQDVDLRVHPSGIVPQLQNVVATVDLGCKLDLKEIALQARNAEYNPKRFAAVIMRIREPKTTALIFASGKMVCTGAKSEQDSKLAAKKYCRIVQRTGFQDVKMKEFKIQNIVGSCDVKFPIRLEGLCMAHGYFATYEPELFPGLIYRMKDPKIVLLIFVSGKVVLTGAKKREEIYTAFENIYPTLKEYKKREAAEAAGLGALAKAAETPAPAKSLPAPTAGGSGTAAAAGGGDGSAGQQQQQGGASSGAGAAAGAGGGLQGEGSMLPPPARRTNMPPPAPAAAAAAGSSHPPVATPGNVPPPTPHHAPPATPAYMPPATPGFSNIPPATPGYQMPSMPSYKAPQMPPAGMAPPLPRQPKQ